MAVKVFRKQGKTNEVETFFEESVLLSKLEHPNIVKYKHMYESKDKLFLGMELVREGRLSDLVQQK